MSNESVETFGRTANDAARAATAGRYVLHTLANATRISREGDARTLVGAFRKVPAIIACAGPSLDRNIHDIAHVRDRALIIACDTAARPLMHAGVEPNLIVAIDGSQTNAAHLAGLPVRRARLVAEGSLHPSAFGSFERRTFFCKVSDHEPWSWFRSIGVDRQRLEAWGSVATTAFALALEMGCDPIVFIGADMAFTDGRAYCRGTSFESQWASWTASGETYDAVWAQLVGRWTQIEASDVTGRKVVTAPHLLEFRNWIVRRAATTQARVLNATGAGLLTGGAVAEATAWEALHASPALDASAVDRALADLHQIDTDEMPRMYDAVTEVVAGGRAEDIRRWIEFSASRLTPGAIRHALCTPDQEAWALAHSRFLALESI
ncbi:MAG TPA: 6-hydroxymethylpterin diphosphokinase MptE-like protein [Vicinamibacterales bacterium]|nr:6-hydroxymethylpterin diphosphokinase MptE-like protein [Vicinamibacterales bacterium]